MSQDVGLLHVYGYRRDGRRYFVGHPRTVEEGVQIAEDALKNRRTGYLRAEVKDVRAGPSGVDVCRGLATGRRSVSELLP